MAEFIIQGGARLSGEVVSSGNKNAALPLLAACLLTDQPVTLRNVPAIRDVQIICRLLQSLGASVDQPGRCLARRTSLRSTRPADDMPLRWPFRCQPERRARIRGKPDHGARPRLLATWDSHA